MNEESTEQKALRGASPGHASPRRRPAWYSGLKRRARKLKRQIWALFLALKDPQTPWTARIVIGFTVAYAVSPIDLIPDFIPILGQLDDLVVLPGLIALALRLIHAMSWRAAGVRRGGILSGRPGQNSCRHCRLHHLCPDLGPVDTVDRSANRLIGPRPKIECGPYPPLRKLQKGWFSYVEIQGRLTGD